MRSYFQSLLYLQKRQNPARGRDNESPETRLARVRHDATEYRHVNYARRISQPRPLPPCPKMTWSPQLKALLEGVHDPNSPLFALNGHEDSLLKQIYQIHVASWNEAIERTTHVSRQIAFSPCARVQFPTPRDRSVNMLPFILGDKNSLPRDLQDYYDVIMSCPLQDSELGKVLYLTVEEGWVEAGATQRRGGLHIESPRYTQFLKKPNHHAGFWEGNEYGFGWGRGVVEEDKFLGGLYMASTVDKSCRVYHALVDKKATDSHGGLDHLKHLIADSPGDNLSGTHDMEANQLVWMTDRTPHEVLPQPQSEHRQFFRLVTSSLSIWNAVHNTPNPKVPMPPHVLIVNKSRFEEKLETARRSYFQSMLAELP